MESIGGERSLVQPNAGRVADRVGKRGGDRVEGAFAHGFGAERSDPVERVGEMDLGRRNVGEGRDVIAAKGWIGHLASFVYK